MNLYLHFPFCRRKCAYCALPSRAGTSESIRAAYVAARVAEVRQLVTAFRATPPLGGFKTIYFGGGTPALCNLKELLDELGPWRAPNCEFTIELHPLDVNDALLETLSAGGVNRISMGVQSFDDTVLAAMGRGVTAAEMIKAFHRVKSIFSNAGIDLIAGWPAPPDAWHRTLDMALQLEAVHYSVYTLIREPNTRYDREVRRGLVTPVTDETALTELEQAERAFGESGFIRYEISNFARPGFACKHNCAVWKGEDYLGLGEGASGREGLIRTIGQRAPNGEVEYKQTQVTALEDAVERTIFALRTHDGINLDDAKLHFPILLPLLPEWHRVLDRFTSEAVLSRHHDEYRLTARGREICDTVLSELIPIKDETNKT